VQRQQQICCRAIAGQQAGGSTHVYKREEVVTRSEAVRVVVGLGGGGGEATVAVLVWHRNGSSKAQYSCSHRKLPRVEPRAK
jgi:hypothetical protein